MTVTLTMDELRRTLREVEAHRRTVVVAPSQHAKVVLALADAPFVDVVASPVVEPGRAYVINPSALRPLPDPDFAVTVPSPARGPGAEHATARAGAPQRCRAPSV